MPAAQPVGRLLALCNNFVCTGSLIGDLRLQQRDRFAQRSVLGAELIYAAAVNLGFHVPEVSTTKPVLVRGRWRPVY